MMTEYRYPTVFKDLRSRIIKTGSMLAESAFACFARTKLEQGKNGKSKKHYMHFGDEWSIEIDGVPIKVSISLHCSIIEER